MSDIILRELDLSFHQDGAGEASLGSYWILKNSGRYNSERVWKIIEVEGEKIRLAYNQDWEWKDWYSYTTVDEKELRRNYRRIANPDDMLEEARRILADGDFSSYQDDTMVDQVDDYALVGRNSKQYLGVIQSRLEQTQDKLQIITRFVEIEMERRNSELRAIRDNMGQELAKFQRKITRIIRVIDSIELYLGVHEDLFQIQEGEPAPDDEPLYLWQRVLFMDEEMALTKFDADYRDIEDFDDWLTRNERYKMLCPSEKGVVVFKPRRAKKKYSENFWENYMLNVPNFETYFLIRNGDNLYRIQTNLSIPDRLFPAREELAEFWDEVSKELERGEELHDHTEEKIHSMKKRAIFLQGIVHRTSIFPELADVKFFELEKHEGRIVFVYDDEPGYLIETGAKPFRDWLLDINKQAKRGTRIILPNDYGGTRDEQERFIKYYNEHSCPRGPEKGLYYLEDHVQKFSSYYSSRESVFCIRYVPNDEYWSWDEGYKEYKNRIKFLIYESDFNWLFINYDLLDIDTIDYYLNSRLDRKDYYTLVPTLVEARKKLVEELAEQEQFAKLIKRDAERKHKRIITPEEVNRAIEWWKRKVIYKRPVTKDTPKAYRMIISRLKQYHES